MPTVPQFAALQAPPDWRTVDFISDLHLKPDEPATFDAWAHYLQNTPAQAVFMLGDLFEVWVGDDAAAPGTFEHRCAQVLREASARTALHVMRGNRDFLIGAAFLSTCGVGDLADPTVLSFANRRWVLTHGDLLCIDDLPYQAFRREVRAPAWQRDFLARPLCERQAVARQMRAQSEAQQAATSGVYACADAELARVWLHAANATTLIHGHTHQPADHTLGRSADGHPLTQVVLSDWHIAPDACRAQVLRLQADGHWTRLTPPMPTALAA